MSPVAAPEPYEIAVPEAVLADLRERLARTRWPELTGEHGWELGADIAYLEELCEYWAGTYDWRATEARLNALPNRRWDGIHYLGDRRRRRRDADHADPRLAGRRARVRGRDPAASGGGALRS